MSDEWCLIESDPGVLTELIAKIGVEGVQVEELWSPDAAALQQLHPVYGLVFLFKYGGEKERKQPISHEVEGLYFAKQLITNACATVAIVNILMNAPEEVALGPALGEFKSFTAELPSDMKGLAIGNSDLIRTVHNSFARQEIFSISDPNQRSSEDAFHFLAFVPRGGRLYELDGLNSAPVDHGPVEGGSWYNLASDVVQQRIAAFGTDEIRFNLCALVKDRKTVYTEMLSKLEAGDAMVAAAHSAEELRQLIAEEDDKRARRDKESVRRRHNYIPFILEAAKQLAQRGRLKGVVDGAKAKHKARLEEAYAKKGKGGGGS